jgi:hypothetical protein
MTKRQAPWFTLPRTPKVPRPGTAPAVARSDAPMCACGCGQRILPLAEQHGNPYFSRACREKHLGIALRDTRRQRTASAGLQR